MAGVSLDYWTHSDLVLGYARVNTLFALYLFNCPEGPNSDRANGLWNTLWRAEFRT